MSVNPIIQAQFVGLYLGEGFADVKGLAGSRAESGACSGSRTPGTASSAGEALEEPPGS